MQYILVFGAVFLIMLAVILLFFFLINTTAEDVSGQVRKTFLKEMEVFDEIIYVFLTIFLYLLKCPQSLIL